MCLLVTFSELYWSEQLPFSYFFGSNTITKGQLVVDESYKYNSFFILALDTMAGTYPVYVFTNQTTFNYLCVMQLIN